MKKYRTTFNFLYVNMLGKRLKGERFFEGSFNSKADAVDKHAQELKKFEPTARSIISYTSEV